MLHRHFEAVALQAIVAKKTLISILAESESVEAVWCFWFAITEKYAPSPNMKNPLKIGEFVKKTEKPGEK